jgi:hypothetical protein
MRLLVVGLLFVVAELCEISGGYLNRCCVIGDGKGAESLRWHRTSTKRGGTHDLRKIVRLGRLKTPTRAVN